MLKRRPSHATVVAYLALFVALGGAAYAATLPRNSVGTKQIKKSAVRSSDVKDGALRARDFRRGDLPSGAQGPKGDKGDKGDPGQAGAPGATPTCPAATVLHEFACIETAARSGATFGNAFNACVLAGGRLPTLGELVTLGHRDGVTLDDEEWVEGWYAADTKVWSLAYSEDGGRAIRETADARPFRCVTPAPF